MCQVKIEGTKNLDRLTRKLQNEDFDWFIMFSSTVAGAGNAGQSNYAFANAAMERIIRQRRHDQICGTYVLSDNNNIFSALVTSCVV